jgi:hypothetical protein
MPESPHRLVAQNCIEEAEHVLLKTLYNKAEASIHLVEIMGFAGFARSTALDGAQSEPGWNHARSNFTMHVVSQGSLELLEQWWQLDSQRLFILVATIWLDHISR